MKEKTMNMYTQTIRESNNDIAQLVAQNHHLSKNEIFPFSDNRAFLTQLFTQHECDDISLITIGVATPDVAIAADKANMSLTECVGKNPFMFSLEYVLNEIKNGDIVYIANPHKISGANFSLTGLKKIAEKNRDGLTIIDEYYFDFYGITGLQLLESFDNIVVLRSFTAAYGIYSSDAGYAVSSKKIVSNCKDWPLQKQISTILRKTILATMSNIDASEERLHEIREEALRITKRLTPLGIQCRITATDFLLIRVASPKDVGNYLIGNKVDVENLSGYPSMKIYILYRIESFFSNDRLIKSFEKMPTESYKIHKPEKRSITLRRPQGESVQPQTTVEELLVAKVKERSESTPKTNPKHLFKIAD